jgi:predicted enzyme related to lactoylglutathione lyase
MHIQFAELPVFDQDRAKTFYVDHFGCEVVADVPMGADGWRWVELSLPDAETALHFTRRRDEVPSADPVMVLVEDDVDAVAARLKAEGVAIITEPQAAPYDPRRGVAEFRDSEGNRMVISSRP